MYEALLRRMAENVRDGGPCLAALEPHMPRSRMLAPLLLLAAIHRMVLEGQLPGAARFYPSAGGQADEEALWPHLLEAIPHAAPPACVQTNEVERSRALLPGFLEVVRHTGLPLRLLEIGASAGLNLRWDQFPFLDVPATIRVAERRGCDLNPIDPTLDESRAALLCFVWPDQTAVCNCSPRRSKSRVACRRRSTSATPSTGCESTLPTRGLVWRRSSTTPS